MKLNLRCFAKLVCAVAVTVLSASSALASIHPPPGFVPLFNGTNLTGWR